MIIARVVSANVTKGHVVSINVYLFKSLPKGLEIQGATESLETEVAIPAVGDGKEVVRVANAAFFGEEKPETLVIEEGIQEIGASAFEGWSALRTIKLPFSLVSIEARAFAQCAQLDSVELPESVQTIGPFAFSSNGALVVATLPKRLRTLGVGAFADNASLEKFQIDSLNPNYEVHDDVLFTKDGRVLVAYPANKPDEVYAPPFGVVEIAPFAFSGARNLKRIELPDSIQSIQESAFENSSIEEIKVPRSLSFIGSRAFINCKKLREFLVPEKGELRLIEANAFANCRSLQKVELPESLKEIDARVFSNCVELTRLRVPSQIKSLSEEIVAGCENLRVVVLPEKLQIIGRAAFLGCRNLEEPTLPPSVTKIGSYAFMNCQSLVSMTLPSALQALGVGVFTGADKLKFLSLDPANEAYAVNDGALFTKDGSKLVCYPAGLSQNTYFIPETVVEIEARAFCGAKNLQSISILNNVTTIGAAAFENCSGLLAVVVPSSVTKLSDSLFQNCSNLRSVTLYPTLTRICSRAFAGCDHLASIALPDALEEIGDFAFDGCRSLTSLTLGARVAALGINPFRGCVSLDDLRVDKNNGMYVVKKDAVFDAEETTLVALLPSCRDASYAVKKGTEKIFAHAFANDALVNVELPESVSYVGVGAFADAKKLEKIDVNKKNASFATRDSALYTANYKTLVAVPRAANLAADAFDGVEEIRFDAFWTVSRAQRNALRALLANASHIARATLPQSLQPVAKHDFDGEGAARGEAQRDSSASPFDWEPIDDATARILGARPQGARVEFPDVIEGRDVVEIDPKTFESEMWHDVEEIRLPAKLTALRLPEEYEQDPFGSLISIEISESNQALKAVDGVLFSKDATKLILYPRGKKEPVYLVPSTVVEIAERAFASVENLVSIIMPPGLEKVERYAFTNCGKLASVVPPPTTKTIERGAFLGCSTLVMAHIPQGVKRIEPATFKECEALVSVAIPNSVEAVGAQAFANCPKLSSVIVPERVSQIGEEAFPETTLLQAREGTAAEVWARENNRPFGAI